MKLKRLDHFTARDPELNRALRDFEGNVDQACRDLAKESVPQLRTVRVNKTKTLIRPGDRVFVTTAPLDLLVPELSPEDDGKRIVVINGAPAGSVTVRTAGKVLINGATSLVSGAFVIRIEIEGGRLWV